MFRLDTTGRGLSTVPSAMNGQVCNLEKKTQKGHKKQDSTVTFMPKDGPPLQYPVENTPPFREAILAGLWFAVLCWRAGATKIKNEQGSNNEAHFNRKDITSTVHVFVQSTCSVNNMSTTCLIPQTWYYIPGIHSQEPSHTANSTQ